MTDKRNIVIKVKYPVSGKSTENLAPKMITEWNVKRILLAAGALVLILASLFYVINNNTQKTDVDNAAVIVNAIEKQATPQLEDKGAEIKNLELSGQSAAETNPPVKSKKEPDKKNKQTAGITVKDVIKKQPTEKVIKEHGYSKVNHNVTRALLTYDINNKEPVGETVGAVDVSRKKPVWVYYFTELTGMKGSKVYHEWLKDGVVVSRKALVISGDTWRTSSRKLLSDPEKGNWTVKLVDKNGRLLNEKTFKVE
ncbi:MAG: DUF2914 domain-containing protein [Methylococcaceae bacterium]